MFSFLHTYDQPNLVLIVLGDHQPARIVSGADADHDVPISIISKDPTVFDKIASWHWQAGVLPTEGPGVADGSVPRPVLRRLHAVARARPHR